MHAFANPNLLDSRLLQRLAYSSIATRSTGQTTELRNSSHGNYRSTLVGAYLSVQRGFEFDVVRFTSLSPARFLDGNVYRRHGSIIPFEATVHVESIFWTRLQSFTKVCSAVRARLDSSGCREFRHPFPKLSDDWTWHEHRHWLVPSR